MASWSLNTPQSCRCRPLWSKQKKCFTTLYSALSCSGFEMVPLTPECSPAFKHCSAVCRPMNSWLSSGTSTRSAVLNRYRYRFWSKSNPGTQCRSLPICFHSCTCLQTPTELCPRNRWWACVGSATAWLLWWASQARPAGTPQWLSDTVRSQ